MVDFDKNLETLSDQIEFIKVTRPERDQACERVTAAVYELQAQLKQGTHTPQEWIKIFDTICEYRRVNLSHTENRLFDSVKRIFRDAVYGSPESIVQTMLQHIEHERAESISSFQQAEVKKVKEQWRATFLEEQVDATTARESILEQRAKMPRVIVTLQEEVRLILEVIDELDRPQLKAFQQTLTPELFAVKTALQGGQVIELSDKSVDAHAINSLRVRRMYRLMHLEETYEASKKDTSSQVATKFFPPTHGWFVGGFQRMPEFSLLEIEMQNIARENQMMVMGDLRLDEELEQVAVTAENRLDVMVDNTQLMKGKGYDVIGPFVQDMVDFGRGGEFRVPRIKHHMEEKEPSAVISEKMLVRRTERSQEWKEIIIDQKADPDVQGAVFINQLSLKTVALAHSLNCQPVMNLTYNEGGNTLIGRRGSEPYVIIGLDTYAASKDLMEKDLGRSVSEEEVRLALAIDYGVLVENIHFVEQPGDFHLDMSMAIVGENTVLLNDSVMAHEMFKEEQQKWAQNLLKNYPSHADYVKERVRATERESVVCKRMEDITAGQLEQLGFRVIRVPGKFNYTNQAPAMNLFNMVTAQTPQGKNIAMMMGCVSQTYERLFIETMKEHCDRKIDRFYFLDLRSSQESLSRFGGISCRTKTIPL